MIPVLILLLLACSEAERRSDDNFDSIDVYPENMEKSVQFGNVYREGFSPDAQGTVGHSDPLADLTKLPERSSKFYPSDPKDERFAKPGIVQKNNTAVPMWFNFPKLQERSIIHNTNSKKNIRAKSQPKAEADRNENSNRDDKQKSKYSYFNTESFDLKGDPNEDRVKINWTTCDEFAKGASFHPDDVVNIGWVPFYVWTTSHRQSVLHKFSVPTIKLVKEYKDRYSRNLDKPINWEEPKLILNNLDQMLLIAVDRSGLFYGIPKYEFPMSLRGKEGVKIPTKVVRLKIEDPYLVMMYCHDERPYATAMAAAGQEPPTDQEKTAEADSIGFRGPGSPVTRDIVFEQQRLHERIQDEKDREESKRIYLHRDYGMFPPEEIKRVQDEVKKPGEVYGY